VYELSNRSLSEVVAEIKRDAAEFLQTRYQMLLAEMKEKADSWKYALLWMGVALLMGLVAFLLLTGALVAGVAYVLGVGWALLVVGVAYLILGAVAAAIVYRELKDTGVAPTRTLQVLQQDKEWLQREARSA
jgi:uncharacterized membrane protein YqjE